MDGPKSSAPAHPTKGSATRLPDHELITEHVETAREIAGRTYVEDLRRISMAAQATLSRELEDLDP